MLLNLTKLGNSEKISYFLSSVSDMFTGDFNKTSEDIQEYKDEILNIELITNCSSDKSNLRGDFNNVLQDTKRAEEKIKKKMASNNG